MCTSGTVAGHAVGTVAVAVCVLCGHQRDVPAHSTLQLCAEISCRSCMRQPSAGHTLTDQPAAPVVAPCVCLRACVSRCRGAVGASHPLSQGRNQPQRRSSPPPLWQKWSAPRAGPAPTAQLCVCVCARARVCARAGAHTSPPNLAATEASRLFSRVGLTQSSQSRVTIF